MGTQRFGYTAVLHWKIDNRHFLAMPCEVGRKAGASSPSDLAGASDIR